MFSENAKKFIIREVSSDKGRLNEYVISNVEIKIHCLELALRVSENLERLANLKNSIADHLNEIADNPNALNLEKIQKVAQYLEVFIYLKDPTYYKGINGFNGNLSNETVKEVKKSGQMNNSLSIPEALKKLEILSNEQYNNLRQNYKNPFQYQTFSPEMKIYANLYYLRNEVSHADRDLSITQKWEYLKEILIVYLEVAGKFRKNLEKELNRINLNDKTNAQNYMKKIIKDYEQRPYFEYIALDGKEKNKENQVITLVDMIKQNNNCRIKLLGNAGMGKTSTILYLAYLDALNFNNRVPVLVSLKDIDESTTILNIMANKEHLDCQESVLKELLENGYINAYFDGINEISNEEIRRRIVKELNDFIVNYDKVKIILTDREINNITVTDNVKPYIIEKLTDDKIKLFVKKNTENKDLADLILEHIFNDNNLKELVRVPFRLYKLIQIISMDGNIPKDALEFDEFFKLAIIEREVKEKNVAEARNLTYFIKAIMDSKEEIYQRDYLLDIVSDAINKRNLSNENSDKVIDLLQELGILEEVSFNNYRFSNYQLREIKEEIDNEEEQVSW